MSCDELTEGPAAPANTTLIWPLFRVSAVASSFARGERFVPPVESRITEGPAMVAESPMVISGVAALARPLRTMEAEASPLTRSKVPPPSMRIFPSAPVTLPTDAMEDCPVSVSPPSDARMISGPESTAPGLSNVKLVVLTSTVVPSFPRLRTPPMSKLSTSQAASTAVSKATGALTGDMPVPPVRTMSAKLLISTCAPRPGNKASRPPDCVSRLPDNWSPLFPWNAA